MARMNVKDKPWRTVASETHARWLDGYMSRFAYSAVALHIGLRGWDVMRNGIYTAIGEFNDQYCNTEEVDREQHLCYKYNRTHGKASPLFYGIEFFGYDLWRIFGKGIIW